MKIWLRFLDWPLRAKMAALLVMASVLPLAIAAFIDIREARQRLIENTSSLLTARGDQLAGELDALNQSYQRSVERFAHLPAIVRFCQATPAEAERLKSEVRAILDVHPASDSNERGLAILDPKGVVQVATEAALVGSDLSYQRHVREALSGRAVTSDLYIARAEVGSGPTIAYLMPVRARDQAVIGVVALWLRAEAVWQIMKASNARAGRGSFAVLFDHSGIRIAHSYNADIVFHPGSQLDPSTVDALVGEQRFGPKTRELLGQVRSFPEQYARALADSPSRELFRGFAPVNQKWNYGVARRFRAVPWTVFYMMPEGDLNAQVAAMTHSKLRFAGVIILLALVMGVLFAAVILRPIRSLSAATEALASGDLDARVDLQNRDEIGSLGASFNTMAGRIKAQADALQSANDDLELKVQARTVELVETTAALRESEESLATTLDSIGDAVIATDTDGRVVRMNPVAEELTGWRLAEARARPLVEVFQIVNEDTRKAVESPAVRVLREGVVVGLANHTALLSRAGTERPIADSGAPIRDSKGNVTGVVLVFRDQTEDRRQEELRVRSGELEIQNRQIQEASRLKSEFLANMSHELRTPLNSIIGFAQLLHDGDVGPVESKQEEFLGDILTSGRHLLQLINDVLDLSKVEAGKMEFRPEAVDLGRIIAEVSSILRTASAVREIRLDSSVSPELDAIVLDAARFKQVLYNYLSNALKFTPRGGKVSVRALPEGPTRFRLEVEDTGVGIAPENIERLFTEFQQLDAGAAKRHGGTGLGLALTKRLVEAQGGAVGVRSTLGKGSTFNVVLPRRAAGIAPAPRPHFANLDRPGAPRVLIVEDNPNDQVVIVQTLTEAGYSVEIASTGAAALALCREHTFEAITLDLILPDMSGLDVLRSVRSEGKNRQAPVVVLTVVAERATAGFAVHDVLAKPLDGPSLLSSLRRGGVVPEAPGQIWVIDDDPGSLKLMAATLEQLGFRAACFGDAESALAAVKNGRPEAVVLDLLMPIVDGFEFLARFRMLPETAGVPVLVWTIKDLTKGELEKLRSSAQAVVQKGSGATELSRTLASFLKQPAVEEGK
jgi:PAS domain S-box-containing protein